jgi:hypothetical protein
MDKYNPSTEEIQLGQRRVCKMNCSKVMTLPKAFTNTYMKDTKVVQVTMSNGRLYVTPIADKRSKA